MPRKKDYSLVKQRLASINRMTVDEINNSVWHNLLEMSLEQSIRSRYTDIHLAAQVSEGLKVSTDQEWACWDTLRKFMADQLESLKL